MKKVAFYFLFMLILSCHAKAPIAETQPSQADEKMIELAQEYYGEKYVTLESKEGDYVIVLTKTKNIHDLFATTKFFVYELKTDSIILEDELDSGIVKWHSPYVIEAIKRIGPEENSSSSSMTSYYFNVIEKTKSDHIE